MLRREDYHGAKLLKQQFEKAEPDAVQGRAVTGEQSDIGEPPCIRAGSTPVAAGSETRGRPSIRGTNAAVADAKDYTIAELFEPNVLLRHKITIKRVRYLCAGNPTMIDGAKGKGKGKAKGKGYGKE